MEPTPRHFSLQSLCDLKKQVNHLGLEKRYDQKFNQIPSNFLFHIIYTNYHLQTNKNLLWAFFEPEI